MKTRLMIAALIAGLLLAPISTADDGGDELPTPDGCVDPLCIIPCWPTHTYETGDLIPPLWFQVRWTCLPP